MSLFDVTEPKKAIKVIKDHHRNVSIANLKFCDWMGEEDKQVWMWISLDEDGRMLVNTVSKVLMAFKASKHIIIDPTKVNVPIF